MKHWIVRAVVAVGLLAGAPSCFPTAYEGTRHPMPPGATWTGKWDTTFGPLVLEEKNGTVIGVYKYSNGGTPVLGVLKGTMSDNVLEFRWAEQQGGAGSGRGRFFLSEDGRHFEGSWGNGDSISSGNWRGDKM